MYASTRWFGSSGSTAIDGICCTPGSVVTARLTTVGHQGERRAGVGDIAGAVGGAELDRVRAVGRAVQRQIRRYAEVARGIDGDRLERAGVDLGREGFHARHVVADLPRDDGAVVDRRARAGARDRDGWSRGVEPEGGQRIGGVAGGIDGADVNRVHPVGRTVLCQRGGKSKAASRIDGDRLRTGRNRPAPGVSPRP